VLTPILRLGLDRIPQPSGRRTGDCNTHGPNGSPNVRIGTDNADDNSGRFTIFDANGQSVGGLNALMGGRELMPMSAKTVAPCSGHPDSRIVDGRLEVAERSGVGSPEMQSRVGTSDGNRTARAERHWSGWGLTPSRAESAFERGACTE
jgi:hypothetical protein